LISKLQHIVKFIVIASLLTSAASCVVDEPDLSKYMTTTIENVEEARDINVVYTDSSYKLFNLKAPLMRRVYTRYAVNEEFPEGIEVIFFDKAERPRSWLTASTARRDQASRRVIVQKNVVLRNDAGDVLHGPELIWDEKTKEIYTDRFVKITRPDGTLIYSYGFKSNESFTRYELNAVSGDMVLEEDEESASAPPQKPPMPIK
jgi:LPS export ABC transporter protein LptC